METHVFPSKGGARLAYCTSTLRECTRKVWSASARRSQERCEHPADNLSADKSDVMERDGDGKVYVYCYTRLLSELYLVKGLK
jgi:hypothetical protein